MKKYALLLGILVSAAYAFAGSDFTLIDPAVKPKPLDKNADVQIFLTEPPTQPYKEVAFLQAEKTSRIAIVQVKMDAVIKELKKIARKAGCPAVINVKIEDYKAMSLALEPTIPAKRATGIGVIWIEPKPTNAETAGTAEPGAADNLTTEEGQ
ncbi:MAG TPA: hypothetical protein VMX79_10800 [bacterium]|nr:hypothetical protein [bacterium]